MEYLIWTGAAVSLIGGIGILYCITLAFKAKRAELAPEDMQKRMQRVAVLNMLALLISSIGLMIVVAGIILG